MSLEKTVVERIRTVKILEILRSGSLTTVQDLGRVGYAQYGVPVAGAMDSWSLQVGNILVGNPRNTTGLEMTMRGARIRFLTSNIVAVTGGQGLNTLNGQLIENWKSIQVKPGDMLDIGIIREGCRASGNCRGDQGPASSGKLFYLYSGCTRRTGGTSLSQGGYT
ncbi:hypothetical protein JCM15765_11250 [Paradesulfitobacterium aromaticivorans]